jgi:hypothetical protein
VRGVEDHREAELPHDDQAAHVHYQIAVTEGGPALGQQDSGVAGGGDLLGRQPEVVRRQELALLEVDDTARASGLEQEVGLAAEEGGDLEDIGDFGGRAGLPGLVNVREDGVARRLDAGQDAEAFLEPRPAVGRDAGAVGLVERGFENERPRDPSDCRWVCSAPLES